MHGEETRALQGGGELRCFEFAGRSIKAGDVNALALRAGVVPKKTRSSRAGAGPGRRANSKPKVAVIRFMDLELENRARHLGPLGPPDTLKRELQGRPRAVSVGVQPLGCPSLP